MVIINIKANGAGGTLTHDSTANAAKGATNADALLLAHNFQFCKSKKYSPVTESCFNSCPNNLLEKEAICYPKVSL